MLPCPRCETPAIPASGRDITGPFWTEEDESDCPGCGRHLRANITGDDEGEWMEAVVVEERGR